MLVSETKVRVRYAETDQMGFVYYGNYPSFYEVGRTEALRKLGTSYKKLEDSGFYMPVYDMQVRYFKPGRYDDLLTIRTTVKEVPETRMVFDYEVFNEAGEKINQGQTTLIFLSKETGRPARCPEWLKEIFKEQIEATK